MKVHITGKESEIVEITNLLDKLDNNIEIHIHISE